MILDFKTDPNAKRYTIYDAMTGTCLDDHPILYADSDRGYYHVQDTHEGLPLSDVKGRPIIKTVRRPIAIFTRQEHCQS